MHLVLVENLQRGCSGGPQWNRDKLMSDQAREATGLQDHRHIQLEVGEKMIRKSGGFSRLDSHRVCRTRHTVDQMQPRSEGAMN